MSLFPPQRLEPMRTYKPYVMRVALHFEAFRYAWQVRHGSKDAPPPTDEAVLAALADGGPVPERTTVGDMRSKDQAFAERSCQLLLEAYNAGKKRPWFRQALGALDDQGLEVWCAEALGRLGGDADRLAAVLGGSPAEVIGRPPWTGADLRQLLSKPLRFENLFTPARREAPRRKPSPAPQPPPAPPTTTPPPEALPARPRRPRAIVLAWAGLVMGFAAWWAVGGRRPSAPIAAHQAAVAALPALGGATPASPSDEPPVGPLPQSAPSAAANVPATVAIEGPGECHPRGPRLPCRVALTARAEDADGGALRYRWEGCAPEPGRPDVCALEVSDLGRHRVGLAVSDGRGEEVRAWRDVAGVNRPPEVHLRALATGCSPRPYEPCRVELAAEVVDPDGDELGLAWEGCASGSGPAAACLIEAVGARRARVSVRDGWAANAAEVDLHGRPPESLCAAWAEAARRLHRHGALLDSMCRGDVGGLLSRHGATLDLPGPAASADGLEGYREGLRQFRPAAVGEHQAAQAVRGACAQRERGEPSWFTARDAAEAELARRRAAWCPAAEE